MVFEQLFNVKWIENRPRYAFLLGVAYSLIGLISAKLIFASQASLMYIAFTALLLIPTLSRLLQDEENVEIREKKLSLRLLFKDHRDIFEIYIFLFFGILLTSAVVSIILSESLFESDFYKNLSLFLFIVVVFSFALYKDPVPTDKKILAFLIIIVISIIGAKILSSSDTESLFSTQLEATKLIGKATEFSQFKSILINNIVVLLACLILSFVYGAGSILFLAWNASAWGAAMGYIAQNSASFSNPFVSFFNMFIPIFPHMFTEAASYFSAAIVGGVVSKAVIREKLFSKKFHHIVTDALIFLVLGFILVVFAAYLEVYIFPRFA